MEKYQRLGEEGVRGCGRECGRCEWREGEGGDMSGIGGRRGRV